MKTSLKIIKFYDNLEKISFNKKIEVLDPYKNPEVKKIYNSFYTKFFNDNNKRIILFGINPGRFGGGITGIPFTDPYNLENHCGIKSSFEKKKELSSRFIYDMINEYGGVDLFYKKFFISSICPYGFTSSGKNLNYYDNNNLFNKWKNKIVDWINYQIAKIATNKICIIIGKGKNQKFFEILNKEYKFFDEIIALPHPRWILQYRSKEKNYYIKTYIKTLNKLNHE
jgi:hypothetical protein|tara:strand:- start:1070 stop:1747 length:678 start_codon:yes stop_codon:yes gene_type:complete